MSLIFDQDMFKGALKKFDIGKIVNLNLKIKNHLSIFLLCRCEKDATGQTKQDPNRKRIRSKFN